MSICSLEERKRDQVLMIKSDMLRIDHYQLFSRSSFILGDKHEFALGLTSNKINDGQIIAFIYQLNLNVKKSYQIS